MVNRTQQNEPEGIRQRMHRTAGDLVKIISISGVLAFFGIYRSCSQLPKEIGLPINDPSGLSMACMAFDVGAGAFAGYKDRYSSSLAVYGVTLIPEIVEVFQGRDLAEAGKMALAKTLVYGASYGLGYFFRNS